MALDTGGFLLKGTNDLSEAYVRARRDLACRYTLGFYDKNPREERAHALRVKVNRPGLRISSPATYAFRSPEQKRASVLTTAYIAPGMFETGVVRTHLFPTRPAGRHTWECTVVVEFPIPFSAERTGSVEREFGVVLRNGSRIVSRFDRRVVVRFKNAESGIRRVSFSQPVTLERGTYTVTAIMTASDEAMPYTATAQVIVPAVPHEDVFLVTPVLGKRAAGDVVVTGAAIPEGTVTSEEMAKQDRVGDTASFMPLLVQAVDSLDGVLGMAQACRAGHGGSQDELKVGRAVETAAGETSFEWPLRAFRLPPSEGVGCQAFLDELPATLFPPGKYLFRVSLAGSGGVAADPLKAPFVLGSFETDPTPDSNRRP